MKIENVAIYIDASSWCNTAAIVTLETAAVVMRLCVTQ